MDVLISLFTNVLFCWQALLFSIWRWLAHAAFQNPSLSVPNSRRDGVRVEQNLLWTEVLWDAENTADNELLTCKKTVPRFTLKHAAHIFF